MTPRLFSFALCSALIAAAGSVRSTGVPGAPANGAAWDTMTVPGGFVAARRALSLQGVLEDWRTIPLLIELSYRGVEGLRITRSVEAYAAALRRIEAHGRAVSADRIITLAKGSARPAEFQPLLDALGLEFEGDGRTVRFQRDAEAQRRVEILADAGLPMRDIVERLNSGGGVSLDTRDARAPLPLGAAFWERRFDPVPPPHDMLWAILASREMASLYYGLLGVDGPTLRAIAGNAKLESALVEHALVLPTVAPALRIEDGRVSTPGGRDAVHLWQELVGRSVDRPAEFVGALLGRDRGLLAYFYATIATLPVGSSEWVMGAWAGDGSPRREAFRRLYDAFRSAVGEWRPNAMSPPPRRTPADVLLALTTTESGTLAGPASADFWRRALDSDAWPADPVRELGEIDERRIVDAARILEIVCPGECDPTRLATLVLLQREFPTPSPSDAPGLLFAARTRARYPALALELERMQLGDVDVYRQLGDLAAKIDGLESSVEAVALVQFQTAIAMLARARALGAPAELIREWIRSLADLPVSRAGFDGALVRWLNSGLLSSADGERPHDAAVRVLSGDGWQKPGAIFEWEGLRYRVDIAASERERIREARDRFSGNTLTAAVSLLELADGIPDAVATGQLETFETALKRVADGLDDLGGVAWTGVPSAFDETRDLPREVMSTLRRARAQDLDRLQRAARILRGAADIVAADAAAALVYAWALQDPSSSLAMSRELPRRHRLHADPTSAHTWTPWTLPVDRHPGGGARYIGGALLGLDAAVPQLFVRRLTTRRPAQEPNLGLAIADALWRTASLHAPWNLRDEDLASLDDARRRGTAVIEGWSVEFDERVLDRAWILGPRAGWVRWAAARGALDRDVLPLEDLVRLGSEAQPTIYSWSPGREVPNCLCVGMPRVSDEMRGAVADVEASAMTILEPSLRVAQELRARGVPAALASGVLMLFTTELIDHAVVPFPTDVRAVAALVRQVPSRRFDDYVAAVAARGPLVLLEEVER